MSQVTSVILQMSCAESGFDLDESHEKIDMVNEWLANENKLPLVDLTPHMPRGKHPQAFVFGGGYNYFPEDEFAEYVMTLGYEYPENVVLVMQPEDGATKVIRPLT